MALVTGTNGDDYITFQPEFGAPGGLNLIGYMAGDTIAAGDGNDTIEAAKTGVTIYGGGTGFDTLMLHNLDGVNLDLGAGTMSSGGVLVGTFSANDFEAIHGTDLADKIVGAGARAIKVNGDDGNDEITGSLNDDSLFGDDGNDLLDGSDGDDLLNGGQGNDRMTGGAGADHMTGGSGTDTVFYTASGSGVTVDLSDLDGLGSGGDAEGDVLRGVENVFGSAYADVFLGSSESNIINGGGGADKMAGGEGDDTYVVADSGVVIVEKAGFGTDTVVSTKNYKLAAGVEIETLRLAISTGSTALNLTGNEFANELIGNAGMNTLDGGAGNDVMRGGGGNDTYYVTTGDTISETVGGGIDTVIAGSSFELAAGLEIEVLKLVQPFFSFNSYNLTGNKFNNELIGDIGHNVLNGGGGNDVMRGGGGNDTYMISEAGDKVFEDIYSPGVDTVVSTRSYVLDFGQSVEVLRFNPSTGTTAMNLTGNVYRQDLIGNAGKNTLNGGYGRDTLTGGDGDDIFYFNTTLNGTDNLDNILDFSNISGNHDTIALKNTIFTLLPTGALDASMFKANAFAVATDANDHILYNTTTGDLFYDTNGSAAGGATQFATLNGAPTLTASDFLIV